jgi:hypothetical protein
MMHIVYKLTSPNDKCYKGYKIELVDQPTLVNRVTQQIAA